MIELGLEIGNRHYSREGRGRAGSHKGTRLRHIEAITHNRGPRNAIIASESFLAIVGMA